MMQIFGAIKWIYPLLASAGSLAQNMDRTRIAILPFTSIGRGDDDGYLSEGITDELTSLFSKLPHVKVIARSLVTKFKNSHLPPAQLGAELHAGTLVEGSVRRVGNHVRISARLIDAASEEYLVSREYEGSLDELYSIEKRIATQLTGQIGNRRELASMGGPDRRVEERSPNPSAYLHYLKGRFFAGKRTHDGLRLARQNLEKAVQEDPTFAPALSFLATVYHLMAYYGLLPPREAYEAGYKLAERAMKLDAKCPETYLFMAARSSAFDHDWSASETNYRRAIELQPDFAVAHQWYAGLLMLERRFDEAKKEAATAARLEPLSVSVALSWGRVYFYARDYGKAIRIYQEAIEMEPGSPIAYYWLGLAYLHQGHPVEAERALDKGIALASDDPLLVSALAQAYAVEGKNKKARALLSDLIGVSRRAYLSSYFLAEVYAMLGEKDAAIASLHKAAEERADHLTYLSINPSFDSLRNDPAFKLIVHEMGLDEHGRI